jgi:hypothetical protein
MVFLSKGEQDLEGYQDTHQTVNSSLFWAAVKCYFYFLQGQYTDII